MSLISVAEFREPKKRKLRIPEKNVQETVRDFMELDGWRALRTDPVSDRRLGKGFGEVGMPDYLFIRYCDPAIRYNEPQRDIIQRALCQVLWIEFKVKSKPPKPHQLLWHAKERERGALMLVVDDIDEYIYWYKRSGLCRRML